MRLLRSLAPAVLLVAAGAARAQDVSIPPPESPIHPTPAVCPSPMAEIPGARPLAYRHGGDKDLRLHILRPPERHRPHPTIVMFDDGGPAGPTSIAPRAQAMAARGYVVVLADLRTTCRDDPSPSDDVAEAVTAYDFVRTHHVAIGADPLRIILAGGGDGGRLAFEAGLRASEADKPAAIMTFGANFGQETNADLRLDAMPPVAMFHATQDPVAPFSQSEDLCRRIRAAGRPCVMTGYARDDHDFFRSTELDPTIGLSPSEDTLDRALAFLRTIGLDPDRPADVYLLAGQSNMSGRGRLDELTAAEKIPDAAISLYGNDGRLKLATEPLDTAEGQIDPVSADPYVGVGPGLPFARTLRRLNGRPIELVPCALGATAMAQWAPGGGRNTLFGSCLARAREAGYRVAGILWYQGEGDAISEPAAHSWRSHYLAMIERWRADLGQPRVPVVFVKLADPPDPKVRGNSHPYWRIVQAQQDATHADCMAMVSAEGSPKMPDETHLTTEAQRRLGAALADAMGALQSRGCR